mgnify:CR=1
MELKPIKASCESFFLVSSNRTFMELKQEISSAKYSLSLCSNRTFMELKLIPPFDYLKIRMF